MTLRSASSANNPAELTLRLPKLHPSQERVRAESRRFNVLGMGRRWGKTTYGIDALLDDPRELGALHGYPVAWFAPNSKLFDEVWHTAVTLLRPITRRVDSQKNRIDLITGGVFDFWTLHNTDDPGRGRKYGKVFIDEAAIVPSERLRKQWLEAIRPTLTDYRGGADFGSTPKGTGYFQELYELGQDPDEPEWMSWQLPTTANPFIDPEEVEAARRSLPSAVFRQEYLAEFVTDFGAVFKPPAYYDPSELPGDGYREATGCDFAYTSKAGDWTVFLTGRLHNGIIYITDLYRDQAEATVWAQHLRSKPSPFAYIGGQESGIAAFLRKDYAINISTERAVSDKLARAQPVSAAWNRGEVRLPAGAPITTEIEAEVLAFTGDPRVDAHDDICLVAGTAVETSHGPRPIEAIKPGCLVLTRDGYKPVLASGMTSPSAAVLTLELECGAHLTGTPNHPVWVDGVGWKRMDALAAHDRIAVWHSANANGKQLTTGAHGTTDTLPARTGTSASITATDTRSGSGSKRSITARCTSIITAPFQRAMSFITATGTRLITTLPTLKRSLRQSTSRRTGSPNALVANGNASTWIQSGRSQRNGTAPPRGSHGTESTASAPGRAESPNRQCAPTAAANTTRSSPPAAAPAVSSVRRRCGARKSQPVNGAGRSSRTRPRKAGEAPGAFAVSRVLRITAGAERQAVYDLTVADSHEFIAEGVVVHNCDALAALHHELVGKPKRPSIPVATVTHSTL